MLNRIEKNDFIIYLISFISLIFISLLLTSSKSISYNIIEENRKKQNISTDKQMALRNKYFQKNEKNYSSFLKLENNEKYKNNFFVEKKDNNKFNFNKITNSFSFQEKETVIYEVKNGDYLLKIAKKYNTTISEIVKLNNIKNPNIIRIGEKIIIPLKKQSENNILLNSVESNNFLIPKNKKLKFIWPLKGIVSSEFGVRIYPNKRRMDFHTGIDISTEYGNEFVAAEDGKVIFVGNKGKYGLLVIIQHYNGFKTYYGHCLISFVQVGQYVKKGQIIGRVGESGNATGPHLHFEIRRNDIAVDPTIFINKRLLFY